MSRVSRTLLAIGVSAGAYAAVSALMAWGLMRSTRLRPDETPASLGLPYEPVRFPSRDVSVSLSGWLVPPPGCTDMNDALAQRWVVLVHGFGSNRADPAGGLLGLARDLRSHNFGLFMFDMRSCGASEGNTNSAGFYERFDLLGAFDYLADRGVDRRRIGVLGHSMGGAVALMACSSPGTAAAVVADSAFADLWLMIRRAERGTGKVLMPLNPGMSLMARLIYGVNIAEVSPARNVAFSETPVFIIHGEEDHIVPPEHARLLAKSAGSNFREVEGASGNIWIVPETGHLEAYRMWPDEYVGRVTQFFDTHLEAGVGSRSVT